MGDLRHRARDHLLRLLRLSIKCIGAGVQRKRRKTHAPALRRSALSAAHARELRVQRPYALLLLRLLLRLAQQPSLCPRRTRISRSRPTARRISPAEARAVLPASTSALSASAYPRAAAPASSRAGCAHLRSQAT
ncbi:hypothetical protein FB451DRAFT_1393760 [Mycena latifolia]|nr:hypothetical protein FB451DRAFT_1393760 [Mycena latifolia]